MRLRVLLAIVCAQWQRWRRDRVVTWIALGTTTLLLCSLGLNLQQAHTQATERSQMQAISQQDWESQPDRHPHRVVHFGDFAFKPVQFFARWDWGVEQHAGTSIYLEGHRQNTANFSQAAQSSSLQQFGALSPAFVVQVVIPLLLIFLGFSSLSRERETGLLTQLLASGARASELVFGQFLALFLLGSAALLPLLGLLIWAVFVPGSEALRGAILLLGYVGYLAIVAAAITAIAGFARNAHGALMVSLSLWVLMCVLMPRAASYFARSQVQAPSWVEIEIEAENRLKQLGDSHNPNDPYFAEFKAKTLAKHGVTRVEDLPFNYGGLLMQEGERMTAEVFDEFNSNLQSRYALQNKTVRRLAWLNPMMALNVLSISAAGTDYAHHVDFLRATEARRFAMIQALNKIHTEQISYANDRNERVAASLLTNAPRAAYRAPRLAFAGPILQESALVIAIWIALMGALLSVVAARVGRGS